MKMIDDVYAHPHTLGEKKVKCVCGYFWMKVDEEEEEKEKEQEQARITRGLLLFPSRKD